MKIIITGGHHTSALPLIDYWRTKSPQDKFYWFGHRNTLKGDKSDSLEYKDIVSLDIPFFELQAGKFFKTTDIKRLLKIPFGFLHALYLILKIRPDLVISFGGYLAVPTVLIARLFGVKCVTHEQTVVTGYSNKLISLFCNKTFVSWKDSKCNFVHSNVIYSGLPLRKEIFESLSDKFTLNKKLPTIYITGGKTGAKIFNDLILENLETLLNSYNVIHQCGSHSIYQYEKNLSTAYKKIKNKVKGNYYLQPFVTDAEIGEIFKKADLLVSRSGAHICNEILVLKKKAVLVPIPWVSHNEQNLNAKIVQDHNAAVILDEKDFDIDHLLKSLLEAIKLSPKEFKNFNKNAEKIIYRESKALF
jgi:UDP-N-acetylglucosamine--N-acetylmuramyl-(pentapeptide) pyrophosphoryl-undecaprenol N-acetylglucosamine transferase